MTPLHIALVHFPTLNKDGSTVCTSVTNLDLHDFGRLARTYGASTVWIVHPYEAQQRFLRRVLKHWREGWGGAYNPNRREALAGVRLVDDLAAVCQGMEQESGSPPRLIGTSAQKRTNTIGYGELRAEMAAEPAVPRCLVFGTGWGLHPEAMMEMDQVLEPIYGPTGWNHLSVRAAAAIILDRLAGTEIPPTGQTG